MSPLGLLSLCVVTRAHCVAVGLLLVPSCSERQADSVFLEKLELCYSSLLELAQRGEAWRGSGPGWKGLRLDLL